MGLFLYGPEYHFFLKVRSLTRHEARFILENVEAMDGGRLSAGNQAQVAAGRTGRMNNRFHEEIRMK
jgi:hypothetical protein